MRQSHMLLSGALLALTLFMAWEVRLSPDERTELVLFDQYGHVASGTKFGVTVGMTWSAADSAVRQLFTPGYVNCETETRGQTPYGGRAFCKAPPQSGFAKVSYRDQSWRNGVITLTFDDGRVTTIGWHYPGPFYIYI